MDRGSSLTGPIAISVALDRRGNLAVFDQVGFVVETDLPLVYYLDHRQIGAGTMPF